LQKGGDVTSVKWKAMAEPVLGRGAKGAWDGVDALNPSVVKWNGRYWNLYSGYDGKIWRTGAAVSDDGLKWEKLGIVVSPDAHNWEGGYIAANGSMEAHGNELLYWYQAGTPPRIGLARSRDGEKWTKHAESVLGPGPRGSWDERAAADPYAVRVGDEFYMYYLGEDRARRQRLGVARSANGVDWVKLRTNPVMQLGEDGSFDEHGLGEPAVWQAAGRYWMLYTGRDRKENRRLGLASSRDGVAWERWKGWSASGDQQWNEKVLCDPTVEVTRSGVRVWFGGGDVAHPAENVNGQIGLAELKMERP
jgi:predicted GH43/DUF377 family glycosyl hydrolase